MINARQQQAWRHSRLFQVLALSALLSAAAGQKPAAAEVPPVPAGCPATTLNFSNPSPVPIPTGPAVVTSTITVSGAGPALWDLNVTTFITHDFPGDMDITLTSPAGTVVTLTTDNGGGNDGVFNGTRWDDQANPGGQVPYANNGGQVTDHAFVNGMVATPLAPEEALGAFFNENPNGTWTLTISDDAADDGGNLASWSLAVTTLPVIPAGGSSANASQDPQLPLAIPSGAPPNVVASTLDFSTFPGVRICRAVVQLTITHSSCTDLDITLTSPAGTVVTLTTDNGAGNDNVFNGSTFADDNDPDGQVPYGANDGLVTDHPYVNGTPATTLVPEEPMSAFLGEDPIGTWTLTISDDADLNGGALVSWWLVIQRCEFPEIDGDGITCDNCAGVPNLDQSDVDSDGSGDVCDNCPDLFNSTQLDADTDGVGDACDNCVQTHNTDQADADGDGTGDACDPCPLDAANDADGDGVCGNVDNCPAVANPAQENADGDGVGAACEECDGDPAKTAPGVCGCGVADADTDADGTLDCNDGCPNDAAKTAAGTCGCGTPDIDSDGDGNMDCTDGCPNDAAKSAPGACGCGASDADADGNGVADCNDPPLEPDAACGACGPSGTGFAASLLALCLLNRGRRRPRHGRA